MQALVDSSRPAELARRPPPECGFTLLSRVELADGGETWELIVCREVGDHHCHPRAQRVVEFFRDTLVHTKGRYARRRFLLEHWQEVDIIRPLFGTVVWSEEVCAYVRQYRLAWIEVARKNGKSELAAGIVLYLLTADGEESAEIYGAAKTTKQAGKVGEVVDRMRKLIPELNGDARNPLTGELGIVRYNRNKRRHYVELTNSYYEIIAADADNELGGNPHGTVVDEVLAQASPDLWNALRTAEGTRDQALMVGLTTAGNDPDSFAAVEHGEMLKIAEDPSRAPHIFVYIRGLPRTVKELGELYERHPGHPDLPVSIDPFDEANWKWPNPALDSFLSRQSIRDQALEARNNPAKENAFRQFKCNQWVSQVTRWMQLHVWGQQGNIQIVDEERLVGRPCYAGLDLSSTTDLTAWVLLFPPRTEGDAFEVLWRFWTPEVMVAYFDEYLGDRASVWCREGLLYATEGDWVDYAGDPTTGMSTSALTGLTVPSVQKQIELDAGRFAIQRVGYDTREASATAQFMLTLGLDIEPVRQGFWLSEPLKEIMRLAQAGRLCHGAHPVAQWNVDSAEVKQDDDEHLKLVKPNRKKSGKRVDGIAALADAVAVMLKPADEKPQGSNLDAWKRATTWTCGCGTLNSQMIEVCGRCGRTQYAAG